MSQETMVDVFGRNSFGQFPRTISPKFARGASGGMMAAETPSPETAAQWFTAYHSRLTPRSSSLAGSIQPVLDSDVMCGFLPEQGRAMETASLMTKASFE